MSMIIEQALGLGGTSGLIGGSTVGTILGVNPYASPHDAWQIMTGRLQVPETAAMRRGTILEPVVAALSTRESMMPDDWREWRTAADGERVTTRDPAVRTARWSADDCLTMSIDRTVHVRDYAGSELMIGIQEIKTSNLFAKYEGGTIEVGDFSVTVDVPPGHWLQVQQYMTGFCVPRAWLTTLRATEAMFDALIAKAMAGAVYDEHDRDPGESYHEIKIEPHGKVWLTDDDVERAADFAEFLVLSKAAKLLVRCIEQHPAYLEVIAPRLREWHERHVVADVPPPIDGSEACTQMLQDAAGERSGEAPVNAEIAAVASEVARIESEERAHKAALKELAAEKAKQHNVMRQLMGSATFCKGEFGGLHVDVKFDRAAIVKRIKATDVEAADPELFARLAYDTGGKEKLTIKAKAAK